MRKWRNAPREWSSRREGTALVDGPAAVPRIARATIGLVGSIAERAGAVARDAPERHAAVSRRRTVVVIDIASPWRRTAERNGVWLGAKRGSS